MAVGLLLGLGLLRNSHRLYLGKGALNSEKEKLYYNRE